jgi:putative methionine-R-sulfoxide reductase with GAF domain
MSEVVQGVARAADSESPRADRARAAAESVRAAHEYRWVGIYDVGDDEFTLIAQAGSSSRDEAMRIRSTVAGSTALVPVLGAESGIVIGMLHVEGDRVDARNDAEIDFLEECAAVLRPLYD